MSDSGAMALCATCPKDTFGVLLVGTHGVWEAPIKITTPGNKREHLSECFECTKDIIETVELIWAL
jgi:hypothetical protein